MQRAYVFLMPIFCETAFLFSLQYMFMTEVDSSRKKAVHDELARLLVQYLRQQTADEDHIPKLLDVRWGRGGRELGDF